MKRNPRKLAVELIGDILDNEGYSNIVLKKVNKMDDLEIIDRNLVYKLVYGVVENKIYLDYVIRKLSSVRLKKIDSKILNVLRISIYQINYMDKIPHFAVVNEAVKLAKKINHRYGSFVNAILRNYIRNVDKYNEIDETDRIKILSIKYSLQEWMVRMFDDKFKDDLEDFLKEINNEPKLVLRVNTLKINRDELIDLLEKKGMLLEKSQISEYGIIVNSLGSNVIDVLPEFHNGLFYIQDESSMLVAEILGAKSGERILDLCSAPGGKTAHIAQLMDNKGEIQARDIFEHKLRLMENTFERLGISIVNAAIEDGRILKDSYFEGFDRVLVDAPCSGLGIVRRKPEIKYRVTEKTIVELSAIQYDILLNGSKYLKNGGTLVYSTCTINDTENRDIIEKFIANNPSFEIDSIEYQGKLYKSIELYPHRDNTDGFFICRMKKIGFQ